MKKLFTLTLVIALIFTLAGCSGGSADYTETEPIVAESSTDSDAEVDDADAVSEETESSEQTDSAQPPTASTDTPSNNKNTYTGDFDILGKWKSTGEEGVGQAQPGAIIQFTETECNLYSPRDTYAFYKDGNSYRVDATGLLGGTLSCKVVIIDSDNIELHTSSNVTLLKRVG